MVPCGVRSRGEERLAQRLISPDGTGRSPEVPFADCMPGFAMAVSSWPGGVRIATQVSQQQAQVTGMQEVTSQQGKRPGQARCKYPCVKRGEQWGGSLPFC